MSKLQESQLWTSLRAFMSFEYSAHFAYYRRRLAGLGFAVRPLLRDRRRHRVFVAALDSKRQAELPIEEQKR